ncbi:hypothetical protein [Clostridium estertheticum]|uniref:hypothetical protein n=1 Tax=Clostridium estertheticum TaxID=238834 RepID=UPI00124CE3DE|nr:hypothetical protein [Clostridium estertheticum]MBZ9615325.1 hypothetical protein [Clostridium estertheticum subsp. laramiense]WAG75214.1 hypothetical protein LL032_07115 [Clostridium estertheticum]
MNIKLKKLRITNKRLKSELKKCKHSVLYEDTHSKLVNSLEDAYENKQNENHFLKKSNKEYIYKYYILLQKDEVLEKDLSICKRKLLAAETMTIDYRSLLKDYKDNIQRLSKDIAILTKKNEYLESPGTGIANRIKNILKRGK